MLCQIVIDFIILIMSYTRSFSFTIILIVKMIYQWSFSHEDQLSYHWSWTGSVCKFVSNL